MSYYDEEREAERKERKRLEKMSLEELKVELDARMKASLIEAIEKLPERIDRHLDETAWRIICTSLGVKKDSWDGGKWEIDSHHEKSAIAIALGEHALEQIQQAIPGFIKGLVVGDPRIPPIKTAYTKAYKEKLAELLHDQLWEVAKTNAQKRYVEIMEKISGGPVDQPNSEGEDEDNG